MYTCKHTHLGKSGCLLTSEIGVNASPLPPPEEQPPFCAYNFANYEMVVTIVDSPTPLRTCICASNYNTSILLRKIFFHTLTTCSSIYALSCLKTCNMIPLQLTVDWISLSATLSAIRGASSFSSSVVSCKNRDPSIPFSLSPSTTASGNS